MKKTFPIFLKYAKVGIFSIVVVFVIVIYISYFNNKVQLKRELSLLVPPGKLVEVNNKELHVYGEGEGEVTCVFMSGLGIVASVVEMKPLYKNMSDEYRIAVVDRASYGFSENSSDSRDIDTILEETRQALTLSGEKPPYVLFPHSISGIEAVYWAQKYPEEVRAIIGLDIGYPEAYVEKGLPKFTIPIMNIQLSLVKLGVHRLFPSMVLQKPVMNSVHLSKDDKVLYKALMYKNVLSKDMVNELSSVIKNSKKSLSLKLPTKTPILILLATPLTVEERTQKSILLEERYKYFNEYISNFENGKVISLEGKHSLYLYSPENIAKLSKDFLRSE
jgi:pimeloyl-ACP methyl ester carboxylesterase